MPGRANSGGLRVVVLFWVRTSPGAKSDPSGIEPNFLLIKFLNIFSLSLFLGLNTRVVRAWGFKIVFFVRTRVSNLENTFVNYKSQCRVERNLDDKMCVFGAPGEHPCGTPHQIRSPGIDSGRKSSIPVSSSETQSRFASTGERFFSGKSKQFLNFFRGNARAFLEKFSRKNSDS